MNDELIYEVPPKTETELCNYAEYIREKLHIKEEYIRILFVLELLPKIVPNFDYQVVNEDDTDINMEGMLAYTEGKNGSIKMFIREEIYDAAMLGMGMPRFTIAHEISHVLLEHCNRNAVYKRVEYFDDLRTKLENDVDPEWQANVLAAELLAPRKRVKGMRPYEIMRRFGVSYSCASTQKKKKTEQQDPTD